MNSNPINTEQNQLSIEAITRARRAIREHRDQVGDYRCWVDDQVLYHRLLPELRDVTAKVPEASEFDAYCLAYFNLRQDPGEKFSTELPLDSRAGALKLTYDETTLNSDLNGLGAHKLLMELEKLYAAVRHHREIGQLKRTFKDDQELYLTLPEKKLAATKLPARELFLGRGCPAYNRHCQDHPEDFASGSWDEPLP